MLIFLSINFYVLKKIIAIIGARPQFIKHAPIELELSKAFEMVTVHTGQHYDKNMSDVFFDELGMQAPKYMLATGGQSHGAQTGQMMIEIEEIVLAEKPDGVLVYGDTNSTLAGALVGSKLHIPIFHVEAGLRSFNKKMPEEINRIMTDHVSSLFFIPSDLARVNLNNEGISENIYTVGDVMYDMIKLSLERKLVKRTVQKDPYYYCTLHRPYNVDKEERLKILLFSLNSLDKKVIFAIHPRTRHRMTAFGMYMDNYTNIEFIDPVSYFSNVNYLLNSSGLITDSGGMQKEAFWLKKNCVTIRTETEWVETLENNWNTLVFDDLSSIKNQMTVKPGEHNDTVYGDGNASAKIRIEISKYFNI